LGGNWGSGFRWRRDKVFDGNGCGNWGTRRERIALQWLGKHTTKLIHSVHIRSHMRIAWVVAGFNGRSIEG